MRTVPTRVEKAVATATLLHWDQRRKGVALPYIVHPYIVGLMVANHTEDEDTRCAAYLHDVLEDVPSERYSATDMEADFGPQVLAIVQSLTEPDRSHPWQKRKEAYINQLTQSSSEGTWIISAADKIHNIRSMVQAFRMQGEDCWTPFHGTPQQEFWFYGEVVKTLKNKTSATIVRELEDVYLEALRILKLDLA